MKHIPFLSLLCVLYFATVPVVQAQSHEDADAKIRNAMSAAPPSISANAAVWDWPSAPGGELPVLREGTNGWTCFPDYPGTPGNDPMCHDETFLEWHIAMLEGEEPDIDRVALSYMLAGGGFVDDEGNPMLGPHVMVALPDRSDAEGIPHAEYSNTPYLFHGGTPYEVIIMPVATAGKTLRAVQQ